MSVNVRGDRTPERVGSPSPLIHSQSTPVVPQLSPSQSLPPVAAHQPRPIPRAVHPQFLTQFQMDEKWHVTDELLAEIDRADQQQGQLQGTSGVAYAGGANSNSNLHLLAAKDPTVERVRSSDRSSPKDFDTGAKRQAREKERESQSVRESPKTRERAQTTSSISSQHLDSQPHIQRTPEYRGSPPFHAPMASPGERTAAYTQYVPDSYVPAQSSAQQPTRKPAPAVPPETAPPRATPPATNMIQNQTQPAQARASDRALPLQEEAEEDLGQDFTEHEPDYDDRRRSPVTSSSELYPEKRYDNRGVHGPKVQPADEDDEDTLNEEAHDHLQPAKSDDEESGFTPRSPSTNLPDRPREQYSQQLTDQSQKTLRTKHHRVGSTDQLGIRTFDPAMFESTMNSLRYAYVDGNVVRQRQAKPTLYLVQPWAPAVCSVACSVSVSTSAILPASATSLTSGHEATGDSVQAQRYGCYVSSLRRPGRCFRQSGNLFVSADLSTVPYPGRSKCSSPTHSPYSYSCTVTFTSLSYAERHRA